jgi:predicted HicB family RNase H-like nuclease
MTPKKPAEPTAKHEPLARATMRLPESLWKAAQHQAIDEDVTISELVARALRAYLKAGRG